MGGAGSPSPLCPETALVSVGTGQWGKGKGLGFENGKGFGLRVACCGYLLAASMDGFTLSALSPRFLILLPRSLLSSPSPLLLAGG